MAAASHLFFPLSKPYPFPAIKNPYFPSRNLLRPSLNVHLSLFVINSNNNNNNGGINNPRGGGGGSNDDDDDDNNNNKMIVNPLILLVEGWRSRVAADPEFPFKVLMEELVGVSATAAGDMATRPNFGLGELDLVLSTLVVSSIVNFALMFLLAPTSTSSISAASSLPSYIFEPGPFPLTDRIATFLYKGVIFAAVGFASGLAGTAISNGLVATKGKEDNAKKGVNTVENAGMWAVHMGLSSNLRYQTLNGAEFVLGRALPAVAFRASVVVLRCLNNVAGGMSFVMLGRIMGRKKKQQQVPEEAEEVIKVE